MRRHFFVDTILLPWCHNIIKRLKSVSVPSLGFRHKLSRLLFFFQESGVLEDLGGFERHRHVHRKKLLPVVRLFWGRVPWRRGKRLNMCRKPRLGTENDFNHLMLWCYDIMIVWYQKKIISHSHIKMKTERWKQKSPRLHWTR